MLLSRPVLNPLAESHLLDVGIVDKRMTRTLLAYLLLETNVASSLFMATYLELKRFCRKYEHPVLRSKFLRHSALVERTVVNITRSPSESADRYRLEPSVAFPASSVKKFEVPLLRRLVQLKSA